MTGSQRLRGEKEAAVGYKNDNIKGPCGDGKGLYLDCVNDNILVVILYHSFARRYHWGKLGKRYMG